MRISDWSSDVCSSDLYAILGMVGYINQLVVEQPRIDRVDDPAHADRPIPGGEVMAVVHRQRRDPLAGLAAQPFKRLGELPRIGSDPGPTGPAHASVGPARHHFAMRLFERGGSEE